MIDFTCLDPLPVLDNIKESFVHVYTVVLPAGRLRKRSKEPGRKWLNKNRSGLKPTLLNHGMPSMATASTVSVSGMLFQNAE